MIESLRVRGFQSLVDVEVPLGRLTVVIGPSSSGKSAFVRAVRALASNLRGSGSITHGMAKATVAAKGSRDGTPWTAEFTRSKSSSSYAVRTGDGGEEIFTKLGGAVPAAVTDLVGIPVESALQVAGQFDRPYLLDSSGGEIARVLGRLTNVNVLLEAAREASRRHQETNKTLRLRSDDLAVLTQEIAQFATLKARAAAQEEAEAFLDDLARTRARRDRLAELLRDQAALEGVLEATRATLARRTGELPSLEGVEALVARRARLEALVEAWLVASDRVGTARETIVAEAAKVEAGHAAYASALREAGECPTCGQETHDLSGDLVGDLVEV